MFKALFNIILNMLATIIQIVLLPLNLTITALLPDVSVKILEVADMFSNVFKSMNWALSLVPQSIINTLMFFITCEIAKHGIYIGTHVVIKLWNLFQKLKFW